MTKALRVLGDILFGAMLVGWVALAIFICVPMVDLAADTVLAFWGIAD